jgi:polysaccharide biosynthesis transport protein
MNNIYDEKSDPPSTVWQRRWLALGVAWGVCLLGWLAVGADPEQL